ncbi:MAG: ABC transporter substrate binding protein [Desulfuromonadaceae bacterium]|nr:ABC transporter substrate binding protein [Desulfuromonadaceae bacterium]
MDTNRVEVIYNQARSGWYVRYARQMAEKASIELITREVSTPRDTLAQLSSLAGKVDALWMLPDVTAVARETVEAYFRFGQEQHIPVISFAGSYLGLGAAAVVEINPVELGRQGGTMAAAILDGSNPSAMAVRYPHGTGYKTNNSVLKKFGSLFVKMNKFPTH